MRRVYVSTSALLILMCGCQRAPQFTSDNRDLLQALQTAVSAKNGEWLEANEDLIRGKYDRGDIPETEFNALIAVIDKAKAGDWKQAQMDSFRLSDGQVATAADRERLAQRTRRKSTAKK